MEEAKFKEILERYWLAETTLEEEKLIDEYITDNGSISPLKEFVLAKNAEKQVVIPMVKLKSHLSIRLKENDRLLWIKKIAAIALLIIGAFVTIISVKLKIEKDAQYIAQKQLESDLTLMFNAVTESYNDLNALSNH